MVQNILSCRSTGITVSKVFAVKLQPVSNNLQTNFESKELNPNLKKAIFILFLFNSKNN